ncbi:SDR family oxidoreductase [Paenarthrobacter sp. NPDC089316]|uniref:SDR family oxidoreductase n=1 Tax=unclassified Paenarthrobacter TaxID=2634190 RepID=UPI00342BEA1A
MAEGTRDGETEQEELDEDLAMALVNQVIQPAAEVPEEAEAPQSPDLPAANAPRLQELAGWTEPTKPRPDYGEQSYIGNHRMMGMRALITGGESGIGRAVALAYAREGADVAFTYLPEDEQDAEQTVKLIEDAGGRALALPGDLQDEEFCQEVVAQTVAEFGGLNVVVNNAGIRVPCKEGIEGLSTEQFDRTFKSNVYALFWLCKAALPHLQPGAAIINTSSIEAYHPSLGLMDFAASQAAVKSLTFSLAESLGPRGIRVNAVAPGPISTAAHSPQESPQPSEPPEVLAAYGKDAPLGREGQPAELASTYVLLATEESSYISGSVIGVTGGMHLA